MLKPFHLLIVLCIVAFASLARAGDFQHDVDLAPLKTAVIQHQQTLKTLDSFARQTLESITGRTSFDGQDPLYTLLDLSIRPEGYADRNLIKIKNVPLRDDFGRLNISDAEKLRIKQQGTISLNFWHNTDVQTLLTDVSATTQVKMNAINQLHGAAASMEQLAAGQFPMMASLIPPPADSTETKWFSPADLAGNIPAWADIARGHGMKVAAVPGYDDTKLQQVGLAVTELLHDWQRQDAAAVSSDAKAMTASLEDVVPSRYPSTFRRQVEIVYNRLAKLTIPGAIFYFFAFVCFLMAATSGVGKLRGWGLRLFLVGYLIHTVGIAVRWWLVAGQHASWFDGIPIKNEFESVLMSAWFGATVGGVLELWKGRAIFGAAASFVGWMSLIALFAVPYVTGTEIGGEIGQVSGVLMSYWLYIHVTMVTASYAMITMGFCLSAWWLIRYYSIPSNATTSPPVFLATLDACNIVVLQLAFWLLGVGIILGAVWADQSWGRPWGWDPKETFALVTWIVYLVVVHVRVATPHKAWWTAVLGAAGFFVMLFNWIGVNFFLVGLHSYA